MYRLSKIITNFVVVILLLINFNLYLRHVYNSTENIGDAITITINIRTDRLAEIDILVFISKA